MLNPRSGFPAGQIPPKLLCSKKGIIQRKEESHPSHHQRQKPTTPLQVATLSLLALNGLKERLEVTSTEALEVVPLDDLNEDSRAVHQGLSEELEEVTALVVIDEDVELLNGIQVLLELPVALLGLEALADGVVVGLRDIDELDTAGAHGADGGDDVRGKQGNVLHTGSGVEDDVLLDLRLLLAGRGLVDGHLDQVVLGRHDDRVERRELGADLRVVDGPEAVEGEALLVEGAGGNHVVPVLVADAVVDAGQGHVGELDRGRRRGGGAEAGQEGPVVVSTGDEGVGGVAVGADDGGADTAVHLIRESGGLLNNVGASGDGLVEDTIHVVDLEGYVLDGVAVLLEVLVALLEELAVGIRDRLLLGEVLLGADGGGENEADIGVANDV